MISMSAQPFSSIFSSFATSVSDFCVPSSQVVKRIVVLNFSSIEENALLKRLKKLNIVEKSCDRFCDAHLEKLIIDYATETRRLRLPSKSHMNCKTFNSCETQTLSSSTHTCETATQTGILAESTSSSWSLIDERMKLRRLKKHPPLWTTNFCLHCGMP